MKPTCYVSEHKELEQRVAELEASIDVHLTEKLELIRRAEKAEKERDEWRMKWAQEEALGAKDRARAEKAENFVRELKAEVNDVTIERNEDRARIAQLEDDVRILRLKVGVRAQMVDALASRGQREG